MAEKKYSYLALGDSYTIGESVTAKDNFPSQTVQLLREKKGQISDPKIIAKTGWTTDELMDAINKAELERQYDFVSLLIGVNNQYRGRRVDEYAREFEELLKKALALAANNASHVFVLSIPDWGVTPFAEGRDRQKIADEIDAFNKINRVIADRYKVRYIDITVGTREAAKDLTLLTDDKLHPSAKEYQRWAKQLTALISAEIK